MGKGPEEAGATGQVGGEPAVHPGDCQRGLGKDRAESRRDERQPEKRGDDRAGDGIARHGEERRGLEMQHEDRRCDPATRDRDREHRCKPPRYWIAGQPRLDPRNEEKDRADRTERQLEPGLEERVRVPGEKHRRADQEEVPAVSGSAGQPGERRKPTRHTGPHDRRLPPDRHQVAPDGHERSDLTNPPRDPEQPGEGEHPGHDVGDVLAGNRQHSVYTVPNNDV
jgi:hypothetical protein